jgi:hypothetical protein
MARDLHALAPMTRTTCLLLAIALLASATARARQDARPSPATVREVMASMTIPASDAIFGAASDPPATDAQWATLRNAAETLAASGRLLMTERLARDATTWMELAGAMVDRAEATRRLAESKKRDGLEQAGDEVYATCDACHARYLQP